MGAPLHNLALDRVAVAELHTYHRNPRRGDVEAIRASLAVNGQYRPLVVNRGTHTGRPAEVLAGNHTLMAAREAGWPDVAVCWVDVDDDHAGRIVAADNRTADLGDYDNAALAALLGELPDLAGTGYTDADLAALLAGPPEPPGGGRGPTLADRFLVPPFTVLNARTGWWRARKQTWLDAGIASDAGRGDKLTFRPARATADYYDQKAAAEAKLGRRLATPEFVAKHLDEYEATSVFDPVLCEIVYRWFSPAGGQVLDPWAGGSVRGLVAACLGRRYVGIDLRAEQVAANYAQADAMLADGQPRPVWLVGDCAQVLPALDEEKADLIFGCPPYFDLERYSNDPTDLSTMTDAGFAEAYATHLALAAAQLRPDRFAVLVVSGARDRRGMLRDLRGLTVAAAGAAGLALYAEAVLVTPVGSLRISAGKAFGTNRTLGRTHQDVLVFCKGDRHQAAGSCGEVDAADLAAALAGAEAEDAVWSTA